MIWLDPEAKVRAMIVYDQATPSKLRGRLDRARLLLEWCLLTLCRPRGCHRDSICIDKRTRLFFGFCIGCCYNCCSALSLSLSLSLSFEGVADSLV